MKRSETSGEAKDAGHIDLAECMANAILSRQRSLAGSLNKRIARVGQRNKRKLLMLFCLIIGIINLNILIQSLT